MNFCSDVLMISTLACQIAECLDDNELALLAADTLLLSDALNAIAVRRATLKNICETQNANTEPNSKGSNTNKIAVKNNSSTAGNSEGSSVKQETYEYNPRKAVNNGGRRIIQDSVMK